MNYSALPDIIQTTDHNINIDGEFSDLHFDTRLINEGSGVLFFCLSLDSSVSELIHKDCISKNVSGMVFSEELKSKIVPVETANYFFVKNPLQALQNLAKWKRSKFEIDIIGITGSNGKTIVKEWLSVLLSSTKRIVKSPKSYNSQIGVPLSVWQLSEQDELAIFEAGISEKNEMANLADIIRPNIGILTNIGSAHDEGFNNHNEKLKEKLNLFKDAEKLICREQEADMIRKDKLLNSDTEIISWGSSEKNKYQIRYRETGGAGTIIELNSKFHHVNFNDPASIENITHCLILCEEFNYDINTELLSGIQSIPMRLESKEGENNSILIDDSYNHDLAGLNTALEFLNSRYSNLPKSVIISDIHNSGMPEKERISKILSYLESHNIQKGILFGEAFERNRSLIPNDFEIFLDIETLLNDIQKFRFENEVVLIKGARNLHFENLVKSLEKKVHGTQLKIDINALNNNLKSFKSLLKSETKIMVMVKAFAYGAGSREIANILQFNKIDYFGVAYPDEGVELRKIGMNIPIFVMNPGKDAFGLCLDYNLEPEIYNFDILNHYLEHFYNKHPQIPLHLNIDTGMKRLGFEEDDIDKLVDLINKYDLNIKSIFSHLAASDEKEHKEFTLKQVNTFEKLYDKISKSCNIKPIKHILNSAGILNYPEFQFDLVRLGIGLYGINNAASNKIKLNPIGSLITEISQIKSVNENESIGYSRKGKLRSNGKIATVPIGYADGYSRSLGNGKGKMLINGKLAPVVGNVCMDMTMLDVSDIEAKEGDTVVVFGEGLPVEKLSEWSDTIPYEILSSISGRVKRIYITD